MLTLYPAIKISAKHLIDVGDGHKLYVEECGKADGIPLLFVHGGPGAGTNPIQRRYFDPDIYRIILFDQRGCGQSTPHASLHQNTTVHLIEDIEKIRTYLNIDQWVLSGGSWGSTLSLLYAEQYPNALLGLILRSIFLARSKDIEWMQNGIKLFFPDYWQDFTKIINETEQNTIIEAYYKRLTGNDDVLRMAAAKNYVAFEAKCSTLSLNPKLVGKSQEPFFANTLAHIACHYLYNRYFIEDNQILNNIEKIRHIPTILIHGRYDMICPLENAWTLHQAWALSELYIVRNAGHSGSEPGIIDALIHAGKEMAKLLHE